ncbi:MAG: efflux RND transporter periplasmic adaptor subunit [Armatimonadota bacterium]
MKRWLSIVLPVFLLGSLVSWRLVQKRAQNAAQSQQMGARMKGPVSVALGKVEIKDLSSTFDAMGSVEAPMSVKIAPKTTGQIEYLDVHEGDRVRKGQILVKISASDVEAQVQQAMAAVAEARYRLAQAQMTQNPTDVSVNTQITQQKSALASAVADYEQARKSADAQISAAQANLKDSESKIANAKAAVNSAQANVDNAQTKFDRIQSLYEKGYIAAQDVDDAKAALTVQKSNLEIANGQLRSTFLQKDAVAEQLNVTKAKAASDTAAAKAKLTQTKASLTYATANTSQKSAYRQSIAALRASVDAAVAGLRSAQSKRQDTVLRSPLDGFVTGRYADPGAIASPTQPVLAVQFTKQIWVSVSVPEDVCARIHIGQPSKLSFDAFPDKTFEASVIQINPSADSMSRQFTVRVIMANPNNKFKPGMFAHVSIETDHVHNAIVVPREAVLTDRDGKYLMTVEADKTAKRIPVTPQGGDESFINIGSALKPGDSVITMSSMPVKDGQMVKTGSPRGKGGHGGFEKAGRK